VHIHANRQQEYLEHRDPFDEFHHPYVFFTGHFHRFFTSPATREKSKLPVKNRQPFNQ
jgi:hypothetical protein